MAHNRLADREIDAANPRTASRALPAGALSVGFVRAFLAASVLLFLAAAASLNRLTLLLSPVALGLLLAYAYAKRFTSASHLLLGLCLSLAPIGAWIAVRGSIAPLPILLGLAVLVWTAGFDMLYALQDEDFDRKAGLKSLPALAGNCAITFPCTSSAETVISLIRTNTEAALRLGSIGVPTLGTRICSPARSKALPSFKSVSTLGLT